MRTCLGNHYAHNWTCRASAACPKERTVPVQKGGRELDPHMPIRASVANLVRGKPGSLARAHAESAKANAAPRWARTLCAPMSRLWH